MADGDQQQTTAKPDKAQERAARRGSQSNPEATPEEVRYSVDDLMDNPRLVNTNSRAIAGAFAGVTEPKTFTLADASKRVNEFLNRPAEGAEADA